MKTTLRENKLIKITVHAKQRAIERGLEKYLEKEEILKALQYTYARKGRMTVYNKTCTYILRESAHQITIITLYPLFNNGTVTFDNKTGTAIVSI